MSAGVPFRFVVPAYIHPITDSDGWAELEKFARESATVIVNVDNGPGTAANPDFGAAISALVDAGVDVFGYVHARWGARRPFEVIDDVCRWFDWAPVSGVFVDEAGSEPGLIPHHAVIARRARAVGARWVFANPGCSFHRGFLDVFDAIGSFEGTVSTHEQFLPPGWTVDLPPGRLFHLVHGVGADQIGATMQRMRQWGISSGFVTDAAGEPWTYVPAYTDELCRVARDLSAPG